MAEESEVVEAAPLINLHISRGERPESELDLTQVENLEVLDEDGERFRFGDLYKDQKTIIIFVRHFLCFTCKEYMDDLALVPNKFLKEANVKLVVIACAPHKFIHAFKVATGYKGFLYTDPERLIYKAAGFLESPAVGEAKESKHVKSSYIFGVLKSTVRGMKFSEFQGNMDQQGGSFIIGPGSIIHHRHIDQTATDHAPINDLLTMADVTQVNFEKDTRVFTV